MQPLSPRTPTSVNEMNLEVFKGYVKSYNNLSRLKAMVSFLII